jgi:hypothetical protein
LIFDPGLFDVGDDIGGPHGEELPPLYSKAKIRTEYDLIASEL